jgi:hypothetical protein
VLALGFVSATASATEPFDDPAALLELERAGDVEPEDYEPKPLYGVEPTVDSDLNFAPDRPAIGDSTGAVGPGHVMVEAGVVFTPAPLSFGTGGIVGRFGIARNIELRGRVPDVGYTDTDDPDTSPVSVGPVGVGAKFATNPDAPFGFAAVPEVTIVPGTGTVGASLGGNISWSAGPVSFWGHSTVGWAQGDDAGWLIGGGAWVDPRPGVSLFVNGGATPLDPAGFAGVGTWFAIANGVQMDAGVDLAFGGGTVVPVLLVGGSVGF